MNYTKFEIARLVGSRALQIKMGAPILIKVPKGVEKPLDIARLELQHDVLPLTIKEKEDRYLKRKKVIVPDIPLDEEETGEVKEETKEEKEAPEEEVLEEEVIVSDESD